MGRRPRIEFQGAFYHIWTRGNNRQQIFFDDEDRLAFLDAIGEVITRADARLHAFCFMDNHVHLLVETTGEPLNRIMRALLTRYARRFNRRHARVGHLFQGRYKASLCEKDSYLLELFRYIHLNPVRAGLVDRPENWRWSSHRAYLGLAEVAGLFTQTILELFAEKRGQARKLMEVFILDGAGMTPPGGRDFAEDRMDGAVLGSGALHAKAGRAKPKPRRRAVDTNRKKQRLDDLIERIAKDYGCTPDAIKGLSRKAELVTARTAFIREAFTLGWSQAAAARALGRTRSWASRRRIATNLLKS